MSPHERRARYWYNRYLAAKALGDALGAFEAMLFYRHYWHRCPWWRRVWWLLNYRRARTQARGRLAELRRLVAQNAGRHA